MSQRLTRKEMKQKDQFLTSVEHTVEYGRSHVRTILLAGGAIAGVALLVIVALKWNQVRAARSAGALGEALEAYEAPIGEVDAQEGLSFPDEATKKARAKELLEGVRSKYSSSASGGVALVYLARMAAEEGNLDQAKALWQEYIDDHGKDLISAQLRMNLINLQRQQEGGAEAVAQELQKMLDGEDRSLPEDVILYELAVTLDQLSRPDEAVVYYQRVADEYPQSRFALQASQKLVARGVNPAAQVVS